MKKHYRFSAVIFLFFVLLISSCSVKKNYWTSRNYHETTTHYNYWFNANERVKEAVKNFTKTQPDKYNRILPIFKLGTESQAKSMNPDMDEAMKKASVAIVRHSMVVKGVERNKWIEDCYMVIGKAEFYKHDYWTAIETFQFCATEYKDRPIRTEALLWLVQTYMQLGKMIDAEFVLDYLKNEKGLTKKQKIFYGLVAADYWLKKDDYKQAIEGLEKAVPEIKKRDDKIRYTYILAQLYQKVGESDKAYDAYEKVIKLNPPYEMAFNAKINRARNFDVNSSNAAEVKKQLNKMLKDEKNLEYRDQIYYAMAGISEKENNQPEEIDLLKKSVAASVSNNDQKGISYLDLGKIYFGQKSYRLSSAYYDSCITELTKDFPDYENINYRRMSLKRLVENLNIIEKEDSLQKLYNMSEEDRIAVIDGIIKKENEEAERKKQEEEAKKEEELEGNQLINEALNNKNQPKQNIPGAGGSWYFWNPSTTSFGFNEFIKRWGDRKLEDDWNRKEKELSIDGGEELALDSNELKLNDSIAKLSDKDRRNIYLKKLPQSEKEITASTEKIIDAYYNIAIIYKEQLNDLVQSTTTFEELLERYPSNKYKLPCYYQLYRNYALLKNQEKSDYYKNLILEKYPDSDFAKLINNPSYFADLKNKTEVLQVFYENTYRAYENKQYASVIERRDDAEEMYPKNKLMPKFDFLKTLSIGHLKPISEFELSLRDIIRNYPNDSVSVRAKEILDYITGKQAAVSENKNEAKTDSGFVYQPDSVHSFMLIFDNGKINANQLKTKISDYNSKFYSISELQISNAFLTPEKQYIQVKQFSNAIEALNYMEGLLEDESTFGDISVPYSSYIITQANFVKLFLKKELEKYDQFFNLKYQGEEQ